jgi:chromosome segregation ATPase
MDNKNAKIFLGLIRGSVLVAIFLLANFSSVLSEDKVEKAAGKSPNLEPEISGPAYTNFKLLNQLKKTKDELSLTAQALKELKGLYAQKVSESKILNDKIAKIKKDFQNFKELTDRLTQNKVSLEMRLERLAGKFKELENQKISLEQENRVLKEKKESVSTVKSVLVATEQEKKDLIQKNKELTAEYTEASGKLSNLQAQGAAFDKQKQELEGQVQSFQGELQQLRKKIAQLEEEKGSTYEEGAKFKKQNVSQQDFEELNKKLALLENERNALKAELEHSKIQIEALTASLKEGREKESAQNKSDKEAEVGALNEKVAKLQKDLKEAQDFSYRLIQEKASFDGREKQLAARSKELTEQKVAMETENQGLIQKNQAIQAEYAKVSEQLARLVVQKSESEKQKQSLDSLIPSQQQEMDRLRARLAQSENERVMLLEQTDLLKKQQ